MRTQTLSELTLASAGAELPPCAALCIRPDGLGWAAIYSASLTPAYPPAPRGILSLRHEPDAEFNPEQLREGLLDLAARGTTGTTT